MQLTRYFVGHVPVRMVPVDKRGCLEILGK